MIIYLFNYLNLQSYFLFINVPSAQEETQSLWSRTHMVEVCTCVTSFIEMGYFDKQCVITRCVQYSLTKASPYYLHFIPRQMPNLLKGFPLALAHPIMKI